MWVFPGSATNCHCDVVSTNFTDKNNSGSPDPGEEYFGFVRETCNHEPTVCEEQALNLPADPNDPARCDNFDPVALATCVADHVADCSQGGTPPAACDTSECLANVGANELGFEDTGVLWRRKYDMPAAMAFQLFEATTTCEVTGTSEIKVGEDEREPKHDPLTRGFMEVFGGPCAGTSCAIGITTQLAMNPITFDIKWHSDPTFTDLIEAGNSLLAAATVDSAGIGVLPVESAVGDAAARAGTSDKKAAFSTNEQPLDLTVDWAGFACSLVGNLSSTVDAEDPDGLCADGTTVCHADSPDCDTAGAPCTFGDPGDPFVVNVALAGTLVNQPPTANAGGNRTVECTSPAGAKFVLDGTQSSDPDGAGDLRVVSWRLGRRTGPEVGFDPTLPVAIGVGQSQTYVLACSTASRRWTRTPSRRRWSTRRRPTCCATPRRSSRRRSRQRSRPRRPTSAPPASSCPRSSASSASSSAGPA